MAIERMLSFSECKAKANSELYRSVMTAEDKLLVPTPCSYQKEYQIRNRRHMVVA